MCKCPLAVLLTDLSSRDWMMGAYHWGGFIHVVGVFRQLLWLLICLPSTYFSSFQGVCFNRNLPAAASLRDYSVCLRAYDSLEQKPFLTQISGMFIVKGKIFTLCLRSWFHLVVYLPTAFSDPSANLRTRETHIFCGVLWQVLKLYYDMIYQLP